LDRRRRHRGWSAFQHTQGEESCYRRETEYHRGLATSEVGCSPHQLFDGLTTQAVGVAVDLVAGSTNKSRKLRDIAIQFLRSALDGSGNVSDHVRTSSDLSVEKHPHLSGNGCCRARCNFLGF
jgi:hypothetical protein